MKIGVYWIGIIIFVLPMLINIIYVIFPPVNAPVPMPLAVFPVLYFLCAAIWVHNIPAAVFMILFGIAHNIVSYSSFS
ncbi:MAG: hypothetical protein ACI4FV_12275 [Lachnospiraceae bacterium]